MTKQEPIKLWSKEENIAHLESIGVMVPGCPGCKERYDSPDPGYIFAPRHTASESCKSGKHPHCTCDSCF